MPNTIRTAGDLAGLDDGHTVSFSLTQTVTETATVVLTVGELRAALAEDGYTAPEGDVQLFGVDTIHNRLRELFETLASEDDNELTLDN